MHPPPHILDNLVTRQIVKIRFALPVEPAALPLEATQSRLTIQSGVSRVNCWRMSDGRLTLFTGHSCPVVHFFKEGLLRTEWVIWGRNPVNGALCVYCDTVARSSVTPIVCVRFGGVSTSALIRNRWVGLLGHGDGNLPHAGLSPAPRLDQGARAHTEHSPRNPSVPANRLRVAQVPDDPRGRIHRIQHRRGMRIDQPEGISALSALSEGTIDIRRMLCGLRAKVLESGQPERINHG